MADVPFPVAVEIAADPANMSGADAEKVRDLLGADRLGVSI